MKRLLSLLICASMLFSIAVPALAVSSESELLYESACYDDWYGHQGISAISDDGYSDYYYQLNIAFSRIHSAVLECDDSCRIYDLRIPIEYFGDITGFIWTSPLLANAGNTLSYSRLKSDPEYICDIVFVNDKYEGNKYHTDKESFDKMMDISLSVADKLLSGVANNDRLSDVEKALILHDRLAIYCEYDEKGFKENPDTIPWYCHSMFGALSKEGVAVCDGYAESYKFLLEAVGIPSEVCISNGLEHAWNVVLIDGSIYYVDVTWDDPITDLTGRVMHNNFLYSNAQIASTGHYYTEDGYADIDYYWPAEDTRFDDGNIWGDINTEFILHDGRVYYYNNDNQTLYRTSNSGSKALTTIESDWWYSSETSAWLGNYTKISNDGDNLYYSTSKEVFSYDPLSNKKTQIYSFKNIVSKITSIFGFKCINGKFLFEMYNTPDINLSMHKIEQYQYKEETECLNIYDDVIVAGGKAFVPVVLKTDNPQTIVADLEFDADILSLIEVRNSSLEVFDISYVSPTKTGVEIKLTPNTDFAVDGEICTLVFEVDEDAASQVHDIKASAKNINCKNGSVTMVTSAVVGDTNGDELCDLRDLVRMKKNIVSDKTHLATSDLDDDGLVGATDLLELVKNIF